MLIKSSLIIVGVSFPIVNDYSLNKYGITRELVEYKSPTLNQPYDTYTEKQYLELMEKIFIDQVKDAK